MKLETVFPQSSTESETLLLNKYGVMEEEDNRG